jgi:hypothetical protein
LARVKPGKSGGKTGNKQSITRHPLFPATVALWFGALFGVGSLAIRPSLIEGLIVSAGIDAIIPAAAPPMGVITRILIALALAALGGTLGAWLARRISRPKPVAVQRRRGAARADEITRAPGSRRAKLAADEGRPRREYLDPAPLPGGATILDVSQFDLEGFEADEPTRLEPVEAHHDNWSIAPAQADFPMPAADPVQAPASAQVFQPIASAPGTADRDEDAPPPLQAFVRDDIPEAAAPLPAEPAASDAPPPFSRPANLAANDALEVPHDHTEQAAAIGNDPAPFGNPSGNGPFAGPTVRPADDQPAADAPGHVTHEAEAPAGIAAPPASEQAESLREPFADPASPGMTQTAHAQEFPSPAPAAAHPEPLARLDGESEDRFEPLPPKPRPGSIFEQKPAASLFTQPLTTPVSHFGYSSPITHDPEPVFGESPADQEQAPAEPEAKAADPVAAERIAGARLDDLSHVELLERLALSMRGKRSAAAASEAPQAGLSPEPAETAEPVESGATPSHEEPSASAPPPVPVIPAALRPIGLDEDDDADLLPAFVPPRHIGQAKASEASTPAPFAAPTPTPETLPEDRQAPAAPENAETDDLDAGYSSLLSLSRPAAGQQRFIRIEEPEPLSADVEPVVIFPGKEPGASERPFSRPSDPASGSAGERPAIDPEETERALRTALANIQRMSGAA